MVICTGACLDFKLGYLDLLLKHAPSALRVPAPRDLAYMSQELNAGIQGVQRAI
jgi:hypothetical protein